MLTDGGTNVEKLITVFRIIANANQMARAVCEGLTEDTMKITDIGGGGDGV
jgi:hypothetical protein